MAALSETNTRLAHPSANLSGTDCLTLTISKKKLIFVMQCELAQ